MIPTMCQHGSDLQDLLHKKARVKVSIYHIKKYCRLVLNVDSIDLEDDVAERDVKRQKVDAKKNWQ